VTPKNQGNQSVYDLIEIDARILSARLDHVAPRASSAVCNERRPILYRAAYACPACTLNCPRQVFHLTLERGPWFIVMAARPHRQARRRYYQRRRDCC